VKFFLRSTLLSAAVILTFCFAWMAASSNDMSPKPQYDEKGHLLRPTDYRDWEFLSAGYGMNYSPAPGSHEMFTNVFVQRWAYQEFVSSGKWPEQTMFVIDEREAQSKGSINKTGHFQTDLMGLAVEVKDSKHFPEKWAYFGFDENDKTAEAAPKGNACFSCHEAHAAVEHTFVQFYPTLVPIARSKGTLNASYLKEVAALEQK
jgi:Cytochrome P460